MKGKRRGYELRKRAERQDETRQRIVEAAVALHEQLGVAQTPISAIAERAGVSRPTVYRHFPDERSILAACSTHYIALHQLPNPTEWLRVVDPEMRMRLGLLEMYRWFRETEPMMTKAFRDVPEVPLLEEVMEPFYARFAQARTALLVAWPTPQAPLLQAAIGHACAFSTWRSLACDQGLSDESIADLMTALVFAASRSEVAVLA